MSEQMSVEERAERLDFMFDEGISFFNEVLDIQKIVKEICGGEHRSIVFVVRGVTDKGFGFTDDRIVRQEELKNPTCTITVSEDTFIAFMTGEIDYEYMIYVHDTNIIGEYAARDNELFRTMFGMFREHWEKFIGKD